MPEKNRAEKNADAERVDAKSADAKRVGGPGASHENRKEPVKSKPHARLNEEHPEQGHTKRTAHGKSGGDGREHSLNRGGQPDRRP